VLGRGGELGWGFVSSCEFRTHDGLCAACDTCIFARPERKFDPVVALAMLPSVRTFLTDK
jgi:hypothetical protein